MRLLLSAFFLPSSVSGVLTAQDFTKLDEQMKAFRQWDDFKAGKPGLF